jgi:hypothetical protein
MYSLVSEFFAVSNCLGVPSNMTWPPFCAAFGAHVDDPVCIFDHACAVFDHNNRVAGVHESVHDLQQATEFKTASKALTMLSDRRMACSVVFVINLKPRYTESKGIGTSEFCVHLAMAQNVRFLSLGVLARENPTR